MINKNALIGSLNASQATGVAGSGGYYQYALNKGYQYIEVLNWCSSAGDWQFIISKDGKKWQILSQTNNYPRAGFTYEIDKSQSFTGTPEQVIDLIIHLF